MSTKPPKGQFSVLASPRSNNQDNNKILASATARTAQKIPRILSSSLFPGHPENNDKNLYEQQLGGLGGIVVYSNNGSSSRDE